ncbi:mitochondrial 37S ribosomal protein mS35 [Lipomyces oligophaga]|uniref:mitochondrial 37S ribosomal protein mS35 n=1 Tax=Lipomyces oligophaga TaxID=45792 RepID=UPI0034CD863C
MLIKDVSRLVRSRSGCCSASLTARSRTFSTSLVCPKDEIREDASPGKSKPIEESAKKNKDLRLEDKQDSIVTSSTESLLFGTDTGNGGSQQPPSNQMIEAYRSIMKQVPEIRRETNLRKLLADVHEKYEKMDSQLAGLKNVVTYDSSIRHIDPRKDNSHRSKPVTFSFPSNSPDRLSHVAVAHDIITEIEEAGQAVNSVDEDIEKAIESVGPKNMFDELPPAVHMQVEEHRFKRMYNRVTAWEMPSLRQNFVPFSPRSKTKGELFNFKYVSYMGQTHPSEGNVTVTFNVEEVADYYFGEGEERNTRLHKLKLLCLKRYDSNTNTVHMSARNFQHSAQNKLFLVNTLKRLLAEAYYIEEETFADIPFDPRYRKTKRPQMGYPKEWLRSQDVHGVEI